jgi:hypothetical protein
MGDEGTDFLVLRAEDLVVLGVGWSDMRVVGSAGSGPTVLEATSDRSVVVLHFPPQHIGEQVLATGSDPVLVDGLRVFQSRLVGPSRVAFHLPRGQRLALTVEGLLAGLRGASLVGGARGRTGPRLSCPTG